MVVKKADVLSLRLSPEHTAKQIGSTLACFYALCAAYVPGFNVDWCPLGAWPHAVERLWILSESIGPWECTQETVFEMICVPGKPLCFLLGIDAYPSNAENRTIRTLDEWFCVLERASQFDPLWFEEWIHQAEKVFAFVKENNKNSNHILFHSLDVLQAWIVSKLESWKETKTRRLAPVKEELMAATWHPDRMSEWCLDEDTKTGMRERWGDFRW